LLVLIVEDDAQLGDVLRRALEEAGFSVNVACDGATGDRLAAEGGFDAIILDWMLPQLSGYEICCRLREAGDATPILMLTARDEIEDRIAGLDVGADDYLVKPFDTNELRARLRAIVRRSGRQRSASYSVGPLRLDVRSRQASANGRRIDLSQREFDLLKLFMRNSEVALAREAIEERIWGTTFERSSNVVDVFVARLRRRLGETGDRIETVRGLGYRLSTRKC
jgi:two-component system OmpR family response regulator